MIVGVLGLCVMIVREVYFVAFSRPRRGAPGHSVVIVKETELMDIGDVPVLLTLQVKVRSHCHKIQVLVLEIYGLEHV